MLYATASEKSAALTADFPSFLEPALRVPETSHELLIVRPDAYIGLAARRGQYTPVRSSSSLFMGTTSLLAIAAFIKHKSWAREDGRLPPDDLRAIDLATATRRGIMPQQER